MDGIDERPDNPHLVGMTDTTFSVTDSAAKRIAFLASKEAKPVMMRVAVLGGGCSGFQSGGAFGEITNDDDTVMSKNGGSLLIDAMS